jgi:hypothetical protein
MALKLLALLTVFAIIAMASGETWGAEPAPPVEGLAAKYPGDAGIETDPEVLFVENFEEGSVEAVTARWEAVRHPEIMSLAEDVPPGAAGKRSLLMTHVGGDEGDDGGHLYRRLDEGHDQVFARFYVKFDADCAPVHHFGTCLGGNNPASPWPSVKAGIPTDGAKAFWTGIEPFGESWRWDYYTYWCEMRGSPPRGQTWGNSFVWDPNLRVARDHWICVEMMVKMNDVGEPNGEQAFWIDGKPISHLKAGSPSGKWVYDKFYPGESGGGVRWNREKGGPECFEVAEGGEPFEGFRWRTVEELKVNFVWAYVYITKAPPGHVSKIWFDDIVVAKQYIGPIAEE